MKKIYGCAYEFYSIMQTKLLLTFFDYIFLQHVANSGYSKTNVSNVNYILQKKEEII